MTASRKVILGTVKCSMHAVSGSSFIISALPSSAVCPSEFAFNLKILQVAQTFFSRPVSSIAICLPLCHLARGSLSDHIPSRTRGIIRIGIYVQLRIIAGRISRLDELDWVSLLPPVAPYNNDEFLKLFLSELIECIISAGPTLASSPVC